MIIKVKKPTLNADIETNHKDDFNIAKKMLRVSTLSGTVWKKNSAEEIIKTLKKKFS